MRLLDGDLINARLVDPVDDRVSQLAHQLEGAKHMVTRSWTPVGSVNLGTLTSWLDLRTGPG